MKSVYAAGWLLSDYLCWGGWGWREREQGKRQEGRDSAGAYTPSPWMKRAPRKAASWLEPSLHLIPEDCVLREEILAARVRRSTILGQELNELKVEPVGKTCIVSAS